MVNEIDMIPKTKTARDKPPYTPLVAIDAQDNPQRPPTSFVEVYLQTLKSLLNMSVVGVHIRPYWVDPFLEDRDTKLQKRYSLYKPVEKTRNLVVNALTNRLELTPIRVQTLNSAYYYYFGPQRLEQITEEIDKLVGRR